jgi:hypothetical protein
VSKIYWLDRLVADEGAVIYLSSHERFALRSGHPLGTKFKGPVIFTLDEELRHGELPTFFTTPAWVVRRQVYQDLRNLGLDNFQVYDARIEDPIDGRVIEDYVYLNVVGLVSCADMAKSQHASIGPGMVMINELVLDKRRVPSLDLFLLAEDTDKTLVSQRVHDYFRNKGYPDVFLQELPQA